MLFLLQTPLANASSSLVVLKSHEVTGSLSLIQDDILRIIKSRLSRSGYPVRDEPSFLAETGFRKSSLQKDQLLKNPSRLRLTNDRFQLVFVETIFQKETLRISAEIYSSAAQSFVTSWSMPVTTLNIPVNCDFLCIRMEASDQIEQTADSLADALSTILQLPSGTTDNQGEEIAAIEMELLDFSNSEKIELIDLMTNEFPHFFRISKTRTVGARHMMTYHSSAPLNKLHKWLLVSLKQIGLNPEQDVKMTIANGQIYLKKTNIFVEGRNRGNSERFN